MCAAERCVCPLLWGWYEGVDVRLGAEVLVSLDLLCGGGVGMQFE